VRLIYIYRPQASTSARVLAERLTELGKEARRIRQPRIGGSDELLVSWGGAPIQWGGPSLNNIGLSNKLEDALKLKEAGVSTIEAASARPSRMVGGRTDFVLDTNVTRFDEAQVRSLIGRMQAWLNNPPATAEPDPNWIGRSRNHVGGNDLLNPPSNPDYFVRMENLAQEYRVHIFKGRSIRAGIKQPRAGVSPHPWVRSWDGGWMISYQGVREPVRVLAKQAVEVLGLDFGAVDIGQKSDGGLIVLEVNRAPGLEGGTIDAYANAIARHQQSA
jgi:hypothetical protein